jgi:DeoR/GlpR family transcriptional regulator of sugar metabolism
MSEENFILVSLEDSKSKEISEVLGSKTCKKIISYLSENKEASQKDLSDNLKIPMNTLDYNIKKLLSSGFIQKRKNFFWSKKGKKIAMYEISNKSIVISHKRPTSEKLKSIIPALILTAAGTFAVWTYEKISSLPLLEPSVSMGAGTNNLMDKTVGTVAESATYATATPAVHSFLQNTPLVWGWFLAGALFVITIFSIINWRKL